MKQEKNKIKSKIICVDIDGLLTKKICWTVKDCLKAKPNQKIIKWINELAELNFIVIYTARRDHLIPATLAWLRKQDIKFKAISNNKIPTDIYVDDKSYNPLHKNLL